MDTTNLLLPEAKLTLADGKELHMTYGMFNDIMRIVGTNSDVSYVLINEPTTRDLVMRRLFTDNKKAVTDEKELIDSHEIEVSTIDVSRILAWVADHACHFLISTGQELKTTMEKYQNLLPKDEEKEEENQSSPPSKNGSKSSPTQSK